ncbi:hypothetical protein F5Y12DRAFT_715258 [Xylaria sp. FL1777]|nr:hypothetical protein F5Y12DRAFT_715258 [Xylaria sp. FL1777]
METPKNIDYEGIGEGLSTACCRDLSPGSSTISLNDAWQKLSSHQVPQREPHPDTLTTESPINNELETATTERLIAIAHCAPPVFLTKEQYLQLSLNPLERYCCHIEAHEQLAVGQISNGRSLSRLKELDYSLAAATKVLAGCTSQSSASSSIRSTTSAGGPSVIPAPEIDLLMTDASELQAMSQEEQTKHLRKIAKLRRRLKAEGSRRMIKSTRVRKRSKMSEKSNETDRGGVGLCKRE